MNVEVDLRGLQDITDILLRRVEDGETIVITHKGKPIADLIPHQADIPRGDERRVGEDLGSIE